MSRLPMSPGRDVCPYCERSFQICAAGRLRAHKNRVTGKTCPVVQREYVASELTDEDIDLCFDNAAATIKEVEQQSNGIRDNRSNHE